MELKKEYKGYIIINKKANEPLGVILESNKRDITDIGFMEIFVDRKTARKNIPSKYKDSYKIIGVKVLIKNVKQSPKNC